MIIRLVTLAMKLVPVYFLAWVLMGNTVAAVMYAVIGIPGCKLASSGGIAIGSLMDEMDM